MLYALPTDNGLIVIFDLWCLMLLVFLRSPGTCLPTHISWHSTGPGWPTLWAHGPPENGGRVLAKTGFPGGVRYRISVGLLRKQYVPKSGTGPWGSGFCNCPLTLLDRPSRPASSAHPRPPTPGQRPSAAAPPLLAPARQPALGFLSMKWGCLSYSVGEVLANSFRETVP